MVAPVFVERMEDMDIFGLQTVFVIQGIVTYSWGGAVMKDIAQLVRITSVSHPQRPSLSLQVLCPPPTHLHSTSRQSAALYPHWGSINT